MDPITNRMNKTHHCMNKTHHCVPAAEPVAPWFGGKKRLAKLIIARIEEIPHSCYAEPFVGMGGVFLRRGRKPKTEVINDAEGEVVNLFRIMREHPDELNRQLRWQMPARAEFRRLIAVPAETLTDVQRAARFVYLQRLSFGGKPTMDATPGQIGFGPAGSKNVHYRHIQQQIAAVHDRLGRVQIECMGWDVFIKRYDRPTTLFYLDPPYWGHEQDYGKGKFAQGDFETMAAILKALKGRFILSLNDRPEVRALFGGFQIAAVETRYTANSKSNRMAAELLISNS